MVDLSVLACCQTAITVQIIIAVSIVESSIIASVFASKAFVVIQE